MSEPLPETAGDTSPEQPWPVRHLTQKVKDYVERMPPVWVEGQVLNLKRWKHLAFLTLRDIEADASMSATLPYSEIEAIAGGLTDGARVIVHAKPSWWTKSGSLQLDARDLRTVGIGELLARLEALKERLGIEGLFDDDRKVPLPFVPNLVGLVCANQGDAEHDVVVNARERWPSARFEIRRVTVQGNRCVPETVAAMRELDEHPNVDVIVIARGGGSLEDLLPFSSETLLRAAAECITPLVSAIGHEKDSPLLDLVADLRASTPTDAGKRVFPDAVAEGHAVSHAIEALRGAIESRLDREATTLISYLTRPVLAHPDRLIEPLAEEVSRHQVAARRAHGALLRAKTAHLGGLAANLHALSPQSTLDRGYAVVQSTSGDVVRDAADLDEGARIAIRFSRGSAEAAITTVEP